MKRCQNKSNLAVVQDYLSGERPFTQVGYRKQEITRNIGDVWNDDKGITWKKTAYGVVQVNRVADIVRAAMNEKCACGQNIKFGSRLDQLFFHKTGMCEDCLVTYETKLRILGIYDVYERYKLMSNELGFLKDAKQKIEDVIKFFSKNSGDVEAVCNSEGFVERWKNTNRNEILEGAKKDLKMAKQRISALTKAKKEAKAAYREAAKKYKLKIYA